ncbi:MAG: YeiH family putative sulfate export transporter [Sulfurospirillum sp.]|nr:MAG: YeiH family putative sulfate export transporter [Sulfurospirillum sp.]
MFTPANRTNTFKGIGLVAIFAVAAVAISKLSFFQSLQISPLIIGIVLGIFYANSLRNKLPETWAPGILFSAKTILRTAIVFYGFRITFQEIAAVGLPGLVESIVMVATTFLIGSYVGIKFFKMDKDLAFLTAAGSSVCGAAAVLATEPVTKSEPYKSAIAVSTVVLFGTIAMFVYPVLYKMGIFAMDEKTMGIFIGGTIHEVAQVVAAGVGVGGPGSEVANSAVLVKMTRVIMIAPLLLALGYYLAKTAKTTADGEKTKVGIPAFVLGFIGMIILNSLISLPGAVIGTINTIDTFLLTMAMTALGMETNLSKFKTTGAAPVYVAAIMFVWLLVGGYFITKAIVAIF